ncbi:putative transcriptional regulator [Sporomusaceae bacterium BoRhaA]|uniref:helix-turn-helix transcriptional regulator n=1 Tax=Pelorhabdus rhamnosifermentans TaxID=2772457 RepID=UPI001C060DD9|nr:helix-turn-helix transcriptional regulator [Pelorhabdus rhamnosifermentans]MBU2701744.1 putative transcriptional regulator [Pelorhabdus rhamnosifermentans]
MNGVTLADLRTNKKLTQRELAQIINVAPSSIAMYESGERTPSLGRAKEIAKYFKVSVESIIF